MAIGAFVPLAAFVVILGSVGLRLTLLWRRTRQVPEMALGLGLLTVALSMPLSALGRVPTLALEPVGRLCFGAGLGVAVLGVSLMVFFNYYVFRRGTGWAFALFATIVALLVVSVGYIASVNFTGDDVAQIKRTMRPATLAMVAAVGLAFAWSAVESLREWSASRRRQAIGLADPVVTHRFLLWGVASATSCALMAVVVACVLKDMTIMREALPLAAMAASGSVMSVTWYLTFLAPARYERFVRDRAA